MALHDPQAFEMRTAGGLQKERAALQEELEEASTRITHADTVFVTHDLDF